MDHSDVFVPVSLSKLLSKPADRIVKKSLFRQYYMALHAFSPNLDMLSPKSIKRKPKIKKNQRRFSFFLFSIMVTLSHWYQDWVRVAIAYSETCWFAVTNTRRAKLWLQVRSQCGEASGGLRAKKLCTQGSPR